MTYVYNPKAPMTAREAFKSSENMPKYLEVPYPSSEYMHSISESERQAIFDQHDDERSKRMAALQVELNRRAKDGLTPEEMKFQPIVETYKLLRDPVKRARDIRRRVTSSLEVEELDIEWLEQIQMKSSVLD